MAEAAGPPPPPGAAYDVPRKIKNGVVILEGPDRPPEGAELSMRVIKPPPSKRSARKKQRTTLHDRILKHAGTVPDLPPDFTVNLDHYLYGCPKREE